MNKGLLAVFIMFLSLLGNFAFAQRADSTFNKNYLRKTAVIGADARKDESSRPTGTAAKKYSAVGLITCEKNNAKPTDPYISVGTGTLVENSMTVITSAHTFVDETGNFLTDTIKNCRFNIMDEKGESVKSVALGDILLPNELSAKAIGRASTIGNGGEKNMQNDWAVLKLAESVDKSIAEPFAVARQNILNVNDKIQMCSYSHDVVDPYVKRCLSGTYKNNGEESKTLKNPMVLIHDMDTNGMSSGSPIFKEVNGIPTVVAINKGGLCEAGYTAYNVEACNNYGVFYTKDFVSSLDVIVKETGGSNYAQPSAQKAKFSPTSTLPRGTSI